MKPKTLILLVVAVACGLGASFMTSRYLKAARPEQENEPTVPVLVAKARVPAWTPIKEPDKFFEVKQYPASIAPRKALTDLNDIKDQRCRNILDEGKAVTQDDLLTKEQMTLVDQLKPGQRAVAIKVTPESVVSGFVLPGTRVDVVCTTRGTDAQSKVILQNMLVLAVDSQDQRGPETKTIIGQNVTLAATPEEATRLTLGASIGELRLMLKSQTDTSQVTAVITRAKDLDEPLTGAKPRETDAPRAEATPRAPDHLPPVIEDEPKKEEKAVRPPKPHTLIIENGGQRSKHTFRPVVEEVEDETEAPRPPAAPARKDEKKPEAKKEAAKPDAKKDAARPAAPPSPYGAKSTRAGRVK